jgi:hypothetical protein
MVTVPEAALRADHAELMGSPLHWQARCYQLDANIAQ